MSNDMSEKTLLRQSIKRLNSVLYEAIPWEKGNNPIVERFRLKLPTNNTMIIYDATHGDFGWSCIVEVIDDNKTLLHKLTPFPNTRLWKIYKLSNGELQLIDENGDYVKIPPM